YAAPAGAGLAAGECAGPPGGLRRTAATESDLYATGRDQDPGDDRPGRADPYLLSDRRRYGEPVHTGLPAARRAGRTPRLARPAALRLRRRLARVPGKRLTGRYWAISVACRMAVADAPGIGIRYARIAAPAGHRRHTRAKGPTHARAQPDRFLPRRNGRLAAADPQPSGNRV